MYLFLLSYLKHSYQFKILTAIFWMQWVIHSIHGKLTIQKEKSCKIHKQGNHQSLHKQGKSILRKLITRWSILE